METLKEFFSLFGTPVASSLQRSDQWMALMASFVAMLLIGLLSSWIAPDFQKLLLVASLGPSIVLVFLVPNSPFSQPYPMLMGHFVSALIGVSCAYLPLDLYWSAAIGISLCIFAMFFMGAVHPPAGATAMMPIIVGPEAVGSFHFAYLPVLSNMTLLAILAVCFHRWWLKKEYPSVPTPATDRLHQHDDASPLVRLGLNPEDLKGALKDLDAYLNITEKDLTRVYGLAQERAYTRKFGEVVCQDIMSKDVISVTADSSLEDAWALLRKHKVKLLPVIDEQQQVLGVVSLVDYLKRADLKGYENLYGQLETFVKGESQAGEVLTQVGDIMASPAFTVGQNDLIVSLVPLLSDKGMHHVPVVDENKQLVGVITQSDLIAALYTGSVKSN